MEEIVSQLGAKQSEFRIQNSEAGSPKPMANSQKPKAMSNNQ